MTEQAVTPEQDLAVQTTPTEATPDIQTSKESNPLAEQFRRIAKQEKYLSTERAKIDAAQKANIEERKLVENYKSLQGKNPFEILEHFGITYDKLLQADKERQSPVDPKIREALKKVQELESKMSSKEREVEEAKLSRAEIQLKADIDSIVLSKEYDLIDKLDSKDAVREYMEEIYDTTGTIPTIEEACDAVTSYLVDKFSAIKESKWLKPKEGANGDIKGDSGDKIATPEAPKVKGLSNKMTQTTDFSKKAMTVEERLQAATAIFAAAHS